MQKIVVLIVSVTKRRHKRYKNVPTRNNSEKLPSECRAIKFLLLYDLKSTVEKITLINLIWDCWFIFVGTEGLLFKIWGLRTTRKCLSNSKFCLSFLNVPFQRYDLHLNVNITGRIHSITHTTSTQKSYYATTVSTEPHFHLSITGYA